MGDNGTNCAGPYTTAGSMRSGPRVGVSALSSGPLRPVAAQRPIVPSSEVNPSDARLRARPDQYMTASGPAPGAPPVQGGERAQPLAPAIGKDEPGYCGPGSEPSTPQRFADGWRSHLSKLLGR
jgi:hypothetical protein